MSTETADFNTVKAVISLFLEKKDIIEKLKMIINEGINDWEKWLQLELQYFMGEYDSIASIEREALYLCDKRSNKKQNKMFVDIKFRKKRARLNSYIFLELKCMKRPLELINSMQYDINKILSMRNSSYDGRSFWCVGFYTNVKHGDKIKVSNRLEQDSFIYKLNEIIELGDGLEIGLIII